MSDYLYKVVHDDAKRFFASLENAHKFVEPYIAHRCKVRIEIYPRPSSDEEWIEMLNNIGTTMLSIGPKK